MKNSLSKVRFRPLFAGLFKKLKHLPRVYIIMLTFGGMILLNALAAYLNSSIYEIKHASYPHAAQMTADYTMRPQDKVTVAFRFKMNAWLRPNDNIFQTADDNNGIRLELTHPQGWGLVFKDSKNDLVGLPLGTLPELTKWHHFSLSVYNRQVTAQADGKILTHTTLPDMDFAINKIIAGSGFVNTRPFNGEVKDFSIQVFHNYKLHEIIHFSLLQLLLLGVFWAIFNYARQHLRARNKLFFIPLAAVALLAAMRITPLQEWGQISNYALLKWQILTAGLWGSYSLCAARQVPGAGAILVLGVYLAWLFSFFTRISFSGMGVILSAVVLAGVVFRLMTFWLKDIFKKILQTILCAVGFITLFAAHAGALYFYKVGDKGVNTDEMSAVFQTNLREGGEFILSFFSSLELLLLTLVSALCAWMIWRIFQSATKKHLKFYAVALVSLLTVGGWFSSYNNPVAQLTLNIRQAAQSYRRIAREYKYYQNQRKSNRPQAKKKQQGELYVVVIGEASNPWHWSAYGYFRNTTPFAQTLTLRLDTVFFHRAYASFVHTVPSLTLALTQANQYNKENAFQAPSIIEVAKAAGFKTFWLSNQDKISLVDNPLTILAQAADKPLFTNQARFKGDEALLPLLDKTLKNINPQENNLIVLHLIGSHAKYQVRYPKSFEKEFPSGEEFLGNHARNKQFVREILNPYDNTIAYTDYILNQIYNKIQAISAPVKTMLFFSDHGEDVYGEKFHNASLFTFDMARIPMFVWFSEEYQKRYPHIKPQLSAHANHIFTLDTLYDTLLGILGITTPHTQTKYDLSSPQYAINASNALTMYTDATLQVNLYARSSVRQVQEDPYLQLKKHLKSAKKEFSHLRFLALHTDARGAALAAIDRDFDGLEINITAPGLQIGHAPQHIYPIRLDEYLSALPVHKIKNIWLDIKDLQEKDIDAFIAQLDALDKKYHIKSKTLLESTLLSPDMKKFTQAGWNTSFYIFTKCSQDDINTGFSYKIASLAAKPEEELTALQKQTLTEWAQQLALAIKQQQPTDISFDADLYPFVKLYLEPLLPAAITYNTFAFSNLPELTDPNFMPQAQQFLIFRDLKVKRVLLSPDSNFSITV